jgi:Zn-dependent metalloprotease
MHRHRRQLMHRRGMPRDICFILPPHVAAHYADQGTEAQRQAAIRTLPASERVRATRAVLQKVVRAKGFDLAALGFGTKALNRTVFDVDHGGWNDLPGRQVRAEGDPPSADDSVNQAYDGADKTYSFYQDVYNRDSVDDAGFPLTSCVHFGVDFDNAFWDGQEMVYGDGSGQIFQVGSLTSAIDVIGHELTHGVTQYTAGLEYHAQSGALNESFSDVFGSLIKQHTLGQTAEQADWLIGEGILVPELGNALRSMSNPGTAFSGDTQPGHMDDYQNLPDDNDPRNDNGGVHINSGIPNKAFYLVATTIGGNAWEAPGQIWYQTLTQRLQPTSNFVDAANATIDAAGDLFGADGNEQQAVRNAWKEVGVLT